MWPMKLGFNKSHPVFSREANLASLALFLVLVLTNAGLAAQNYYLPIDVDSSTSDRTDKPVDVAVDLSDFLTLIGGSLDVSALQVAEVGFEGGVLDTEVMFQFDPAPGFDAATLAAGNLVFIMGGHTPAATTRHFQLWFDVDGGCVDCPPPPVVTNPVTVDSLTYENQLTYLIDTPRADYYYHLAGGGFASIIDNDGQDWISFHDIPGSGSSGQYRGIPNMVGKHNEPQNSYFHPGFTNALSRIVSAGPLKVTVLTESDNPDNLWQLLWEFYPSYVRLTVQTVGTTNSGDYWLLYEGTVGGVQDANDVVVRSNGVQTSAYDYEDSWEETLLDPAWVYFRDLSASRIFFLSDDQGDDAPDSYRPQGQSWGSSPVMTVFGFGRVLDTSSNQMVPRISGAGRTFTIGFGEDHTLADAEIAGAADQLIVSVGTPESGVSSVDEVPVAATADLHQNYPNPFNPRTQISFTLPTEAWVRLDVLDLQGRRVKNLVDGTLSSGTHDVTFDGKELPSGMYISRLITDNGSLERKMMLIR